MLLLNSDISTSLRAILQSCAKSVSEASISKPALCARCVVHSYDALLRFEPCYVDQASVVHLGNQCEGLALWVAGQQEAPLGADDRHTRTDRGCKVPNRPSTQSSV